MALAQRKPTTLYDRDYALWLEATIALLTTGDFQQLDRANLIEELEDMGRSERAALESNLIVVLLHLLKWEFQPEMRSGSWRGSIREHRRRIRKAFKASPSLKNFFREVFEESYEEAREQAADETGLSIAVFPEQCPYSAEQVGDREFLPGIEELD